MKKRWKCSPTDRIVNEEFPVGGIVAALIGLPVAVFGFLVMRNPMRLSILSPWEQGYFQRAFFDASSRNSTRAFGMIISLFGGGIATEGLASIFKTRYIQAAASGLWTLMGLMFVCLWCFYVGFAIWNAVRGKPVGWSEWFRMRKTGIELGPIDVFPAITPQMQKEALLFTVGFIVLVLAAVGFAIVC